MTALAGIIEAESDAEAARLVGLMLDAQALYGPHSRGLTTVESSAFGRCLYRTLPEDAYDRQPLFASPITFVADVRIDNREELARSFPIENPSELSDSRLFFKAYWSWGLKFLDRVVGDFAAAIWNSAAGELTLVRDASGQRPLHYLAGRGLTAFASVPQGLAALPQVGTSLNHAALTEFVADIPRRGASSYFDHIRRVEPGQVVTIRGERITRHFYARRPSRELRLPSEAQYVEAYRELLDQAVKARLRGAGECVASHLSGGLDSSAVASTAARILAREGGRVIAFTSGPREGFERRAVRDRIADETALAGTVAARYNNMEHVTVRSRSRSLLSLTARDALRYAEPLGLPFNQTWWSAIHDEARERGLRVLLTGENGNWASSAGAVATLSEFIHRRRFATWAREAASLLGQGPRVRGLLIGSFAPWLPRPLWKWLYRRTYGRDASAVGVQLLAAGEKSSRAASLADDARRARPERSEYAERWRAMQATDPGNFRKGVLAGWGLDERDPTADRRLIDFCFSVPPEILVGRGSTRRLARLALADRVPAEVIHGPRGYQAADWFEQVDRPSLCAEVERLRALPRRSGSIFDFDALLALAESWPEDGWEQASVVQSYRLGLLRAIAAANFEAGIATQSRATPDALAVAGADGYAG